MIIKNTKHNIYLDYVRGIACILIILYHYTQRYNELFQNSESWSFRVSWGYMAVSIFFILSGYLAVVKDDSYTSLSMYAKKKIIRLYPTYWIAVSITFFVTYFMLPSRSVSIKAAIINLTMLESFFGVSLVDGVYWTLANELIFYTFIAIVIVLLKKRQFLPFLGLVWVIILLVYQLVKQDSLLFLIIGKLIVKQYGHMFVTGFSLFFLFHKNGTLRGKIISVCAILISLFYHYIVFGWGYTFFFSLSIVIISFLIVINAKGVTLNRTLYYILLPLEFVASISYPLYLLHQNIGYALLENIRPFIKDTEWVIVIPCVLIGAIAFVIHKFIELPLLKKIKTFNIKGGQ